MSFAMIPPGGGSPVDAYSRPDFVSFCLVDNGSGGDVYLNGCGITNGVVTGAIDLATFFGSPLFRSEVLVQGAFKAIFPSATSALTEAQLVQNLDINIVCLTASHALPAIAYLSGVGPSPQVVPYLHLIGPAVAGSWRMDIRLRHTLGD